jgi:DNA adenine methylase
LNQTRPVLRYHGGKWKLAPWILEHFPPHRVYVEPFGGGGSVLMRKPRSYAEVYNDTWETVVNVFKVLRDPAQAAALEQLLRLTPYARDEYTDTNTEACADIDDPVERARRTILRSLAGFGSASTNGDYATGFRANSHRSGTTPAHDWANYPGHVSAFTARLAGVCIENRPAAEVILQHDREGTLFYVDPPYPHITRTMDRGNAVYANDMTDDDHRRLAEVLHQVEGMVVLSGYPCDLYDVELYPDWTRFERPHLADGARPRMEVLWINDTCAAALETARSQHRMFA